MDNILGDRPALEVGDRRFGPGLFLILGPCVIESEDLTLQVAREIARISHSNEIPVIFKASFDKANRTSIDSYRGPGIERGLKILAKVKQETGLPVISDIHTPDQAVPAGAVLDVIQIPAFLSRQTDLLLAAGRTGRVINIKKGQFQSPEDVEHAVNKVLSTGNNKIMLTERGASFGYQDLVADMRSVVRMKRFWVSGGFRRDPLSPVSGPRKRPFRRRSHACAASCTSAVAAGQTEYSWRRTLTLRMRCVTGQTRCLSLNWSRLWLSSVTFGRSLRRQRACS